MNRDNLFFFFPLASSTFDFLSIKKRAHNSPLLSTHCMMVRLLAALSKGGSSVVAPAARSVAAAAAPVGR